MFSIIFKLNLKNKIFKQLLKLTGILKTTDEKCFFLTQSECLVLRKKN